MPVCTLSTVAQGENPLCEDVVYEPHGYTRYGAPCESVLAIHWNYICAALRPEALQSASTAHDNIPDRCSSVPLQLDNVCVDLVALKVKLNFPSSTIEASSSIRAWGYLLRFDSSSIFSCCSTMKIFVALLFLTYNSRDSVSTDVMWDVLRQRGRPLEKRARVS